MQKKIQNVLLLALYIYYRCETESGQPCIYLTFPFLFQQLLWIFGWKCVWLNGNEHNRTNVAFKACLNIVFISLLWVLFKSEPTLRISFCSCCNKVTTFNNLETCQMEYYGIAQSGANQWMFVIWWWLATGSVAAATTRAPPHSCRMVAGRNSQ